MPVPLSRPPVRVRTSGLRLALSIALGVWLGLLTAGLTGWLIVRWAGIDPLTVGGVASPPATLTPPAVGQPAGAPPTPSSAITATPGPEQMFDQYQRSLQALDLRQLEEAARANPANQNNPKCQFWLEQARTAPTLHSQENIVRFCAP